MSARTLLEVLEAVPLFTRNLSPAEAEHVAQSVRAWALAPEQVERVAKVLATEINGVLGEHWNGPYEGRENNPNQFIATVYQDALAAIYALVG